MVCMFEWSPKLESKLKKRVQKCAGDQLKTFVIRTGQKQKTVTLKQAQNLFIFHVRKMDCIID